MNKHQRGQRPFAVILSSLFLAGAVVPSTVQAQQPPAKSKPAAKAKPEAAKGEATKPETKPTTKAGERSAAKPSDEALERARDTVRMLDDVYKTSIVLITETYVNEASDVPAGTAFVKLFDAIEKKGWHKVRLLDATGMPIEEKNTAKDDFERDAIKHLKAGDKWYEQVVTHDGKQYLRAATPVPVALKKCIMCHDHYKDAQPGAAIGAISYQVPIK